MQLDELTKGDKKYFHISLYRGEMEALDRLCRKYDCSRAAVIGAMIKKMATQDFTDLPPGARPGRGQYVHAKRKP